MNGLVHGPHIEPPIRQGLLKVPRIKAIRRVEPARKDGRVKWQCCQCRKLYRWAEDAERCFAAHQAERKCVVCSADISDKRSQAKYCSDACRMKHNRGRLDVGRDCPVCGEVMDDQRSDAVYCSDYCRSQAHRKRKTQIGRTVAGSNHREHVYHCEWCHGDLFLKRAGARFCSDSCRKAYQRQHTQKED